MEGLCSQCVRIYSLSDRVKECVSVVWWVVLGSRARPQLTCDTWLVEAKLSGRVKRGGEGVHSFTKQTFTH